MIRRLYPTIYLMVRKIPKNNTARNDYFNYGNGVFDGRMINGMGISDIGGHIIDPATSYTYNIELKEGYELTDEAKAQGWTADATGLPSDH